MKAVLLDTHAWAWSIYDSSRLSLECKDVIAAAEVVWISPVSFYEIAQKVRLGKWPEMEPLMSDLLHLSEHQGSKIAASMPEICVRAGSMNWEHRDPFDRIIAATALQYAVPILSRDTVFDGIISRIW